MRDRTFRARSGARFDAAGTGHLDPAHPAGRFGIHDLRHDAADRAAQAHHAQRAPAHLQQLK